MMTTNDDSHSGKNQMDYQIQPVKLAGGPHLQVACFAENVLRDDTGVFSLIRIIDQITRTASGPNPPDQMLPFTYRLNICIGLKSDKARGHYEMKIVPELPNGSTKDPLRFTAHFEGDERGFFTKVVVDFGFEFEGLYWFDVFIQDDRITRLPMRVKYDRQFITLSQTQ